VAFLAPVTRARPRRLGDQRPTARPAPRRASDRPTDRALGRQRSWLDRWRRWRLSGRVRPLTKGRNSDSVGAALAGW